MAPSTDVPLFPFITSDFYRHLTYIYIYDSIKTSIGVRPRIDTGSSSRRKAKERVLTSKHAQTLRDSNAKKDITEARSDSRASLDNGVRLFLLYTFNSKITLFLLV